MSHLENIEKIREIFIEEIKETSNWSPYPTIRISDEEVVSNIYQDGSLFIVDNFGNVIEKNINDFSLEILAYMLDQLDNF